MSDLLLPKHIIDFMLGHNLDNKVIGYKMDKTPASASSVVSRIKAGKENFPRKFDRYAFYNAFFNMDLDDALLYEEYKDKKETLLEDVKDSIRDYENTDKLIEITDNKEFFLELFKLAKENFNSLNPSSKANKKSRPATPRPKFQSLEEAMNPWLEINDDTMRNLCERGKKADRATERFLKGERDDILWFVSNESDIPRRDIVDTLVGYCDEKRKVISLIGAGAEGKSTALRQLCIELYRNHGRTVMFHNEWDINFPVPDDGNAVYILDNPPLSGNELENFIKFYVEFYKWAPGNSATLIIGARENEWNMIKDEINKRNSRIMFKDEKMPRITPTEAEAFSKCISKYIKEDMSGNPLPEVETLTEIFKSNSQGYLYASMLMILHGKSDLTEIGKNIIKNIREKDHSALTLLAHIVATENIKDLKCEHVAAICSKYLTLKMEVAKKILAGEVKSSWNYWETRNEEVSKLFYDLLFKDEDAEIPPETFTEILQNLIDLQFEALKNKPIKGKDAEYRQILKNIGMFMLQIKDNKYKHAELVDHVFEKFHASTDFNKMQSARLLFVISEAIASCGDMHKMLLCKCYENEVYDASILIKLAEKEYRPLRDVYRCTPNVSDLNDYPTREQKKELWALCIAWAKHEAEDNLGNFEKPEPFSARAIYRNQVYERFGLHAISVLQAWAMFENENDMTGSVNPHEIAENSDMYTARWIYRTVCGASLTNASAFSYYSEADMVNMWVAWAKMEKEFKATNPPQFTPREIYKKACEESIIGKGATIWRYWIEYEYGEKTDFNCISKIYRDAWHTVEKSGGKDVPVDAMLLCEWANHEANNCNNLGSYDKKFTARWIFKELALNQRVGTFYLPIWKDWIETERKSGNTDLSSNSEYSVNWIKEKSLERLKGNVKEEFRRWYDKEIKTAYITKPIKL